MTLVPYAIDDNGKPLTTPPNVIEALSRPNQDMSGVDFRDALAVMTMVHDNVYVLVHEKNGRTTRPARENIREEQIAGFTFLENALEVSVGGQIQYEIYTNGSKEIYYPYQVIDLHDVNPKNLSTGYSPSRAARRWTRIDDYIADYQSGFFENGAVPAGQFIITAPTANEYKDIVHNLKKKHKGAGKNNNVTYTYAPIDPVSGKPGQAAITWVPFNTTNKDLALKDIFEQANKKIDSVYGVSAFIRSIDEAPNFATAQVIERNFVENTVRPFAIKKWGRFQHELNRITNGLGYGISFELETPHIAEEQKSTAETNQIIWNTVKDMILQGFTYDSAVKAMNLPPNWALLVEGEIKTTVIENPKTDVVDDPDTSPNNVKMMTTEDMPGFEMRLEEPARALMQKQVNYAVDILDPNNATDPIEEDKDTFIDEMMVIISAILLYGGIQQWQAGKNLLLDSGVSLEDIPDGAYLLNQSAETRYRKYLKTIADSYGDDTANAIRNVLENSNTKELTSAQTQAALRNIMQTDEWRVKRLATSEINRSSGISSVESMRKIADESGSTIEKTMLHTGSDQICEFCASRIGVWFPVDKTMVKKGAEVMGIDGGIFVNNWDNNDGHDIHPNGHCVPEYRIGTSSAQNIAKLGNEVKELTSQLEDADGRTKEAKEIKSKLEAVESKLKESEEYARQLEGIIDGQG